LESIADSYDLLFSIACTFKELKHNLKWDNRKLASLFVAPEGDVIQLLEVAPKPNSSNVDFLRKLYKWTKATLIQQPGLLYDRFWAANLLGIKEASFRKVEKLFKSAEYTGIFNTTNNKRWWRSELKKVLYQSIKTKEALLPWQAGHRLPAINSRDHSVCYRCGEKYPETLGFSDDSKKQKIVSLHFRCANSYTIREKILYFEEARLMKDQK
jgi:hypothetical protein